MKSRGEILVIFEIAVREKQDSGCSGRQSTQWWWLPSRNVDLNSPKSRGIHLMKEPSGHIRLLYEGPKYHYLKRIAPHAP